MLEAVTLADVARGELPDVVAALAADDDAWTPRDASGRVRGLTPDASEPAQPNVVCAGRLDEDDLAALELELLGLVARHLHAEPLAVVAHELDAHLEAEVDDPLDHRLAASSPFGSSVSSRSCGRTHASPSRFTWPTNDITNSFAGRS